MATPLFLGKAAITDLSTDFDMGLIFARDTGASSSGNVNTEAGPTAGVQVNASVTLYSWWLRVNAVTISGAITKNIWGAESAMAANVGLQTIIERYTSAGVFVSVVENSEFGTELPVTTRDAQNWSTGSVTSTAFSDGDYIRLRVYGNDGGGTMASGNTFNITWAGTTAGADGDSYITFTETITAYTPATYSGRPDRQMPQLLAH